MRFGRSYQSPRIQAAALYKYHVNGEMKKDIAVDLGISRPTLNRILEDTQLAELVKVGKSSIHELIPDSVAAFRHHIVTKKSIPEATTILQATGVLPQEVEPGSGVSTTVNLGVFGQRGE